MTKDQLIERLKGYEWDDKESFDGEVMAELEPETFYDDKALNWYRWMFNEREPGRHKMLDDQEFLREWGFVVEEGGKPSITRCALLLFGKARHIRRSVPRPVVDFQIIYERFEEWSSDRRWADRIVVEDNIIQAWLVIVERYMKYADRPFNIDAATLRRHDEPPDYISFREAAINQHAEKAFELILVKEKLLSEYQKRFQRTPDASLSENQAAILAYACRNGQVSLVDAKAITGLGSSSAKKELVQLK